MNVYSKKNVKLLLAIGMIAIFMLSFNSQVFNNNKEQNKTNEPTISVSQQQSQPVLHKMTNVNRPSTVNIYSNLIQESSHKNLTVTKLNQPNQNFLNNKPADLVFTSFTQYLLNFTFQKSYFTKTNYRSSGTLNYNIYPNVTITSYAFFPILLNVYSNTTVESGAWDTIVTQVDSNAYNASIGMDINFGLQYKIWADIFGMKPTAGPDSFIAPFNQHWNFNIPFNGQFLGNRLNFDVPTTFIPLLNSVGIGVQPKIDADLSSLVQANNANISVTQNKLLWQNSNSIQSFSFYTPFSYSAPTAPTELFNFNMDFTLSLEFSLQINIGVPLLANFPININLFSVPLATAGLPLSGGILNNPTVVPSSKVPYVYGINYVYNYSNPIIKPGDSVNVSFDVTNLGLGPALNVSLTGTSSNVTFYGDDFISLLREQQQESYTFTNFYFTVPSSYTSDAIYTDVLFSFTAPNGSQYQTDFPMYFRVVQPSDTYLHISNIIYTTPGVTQWNAGDNLDLAFTVTNQGYNTITASNISIYQGIDTDTVNPISITTTSTNTSNSLSVGQSTGLGTITLSSPSNHNDGIVYLTLLVYSQDKVYVNPWYDLYYLAITINAPKPSFTLTSGTGYDYSNTQGLFYAGDTVDLQFVIHNGGTGAGQSISADLYSYSPDLNFTTSHLNFADLSVGQSDKSTNGTVVISPTARNQTATFSITVYAYDPLGNLVSQSFNMSIAIVELPSPKLQLINYLMLDATTGATVTRPVPGETLLVYVLADVTNTGVGVIGNISTTSNLVLLNSSSYYGKYITNTQSYGDGFIINVPLNYNGSTAIVNVTVSAQSMSGRLVNTTGYIEFTNIPKGDTTAPVITQNRVFPNSTMENYQAMVNVSALDKLASGDSISGLYNVYMAYYFNNGPLVVATMSNSTTGYTYSFNTAKAGTYQYMVIAMDKAGNIAYISNGTNLFTLTVKSPVTPSSSTTTTSTSTTNPPSSSTSTTTTNPPSSSTSTTTTNPFTSSINGKSSPGFEFITVLASFSALVLIYNIRKRRK